jgi:hypothetical protein
MERTMSDTKHTPGPWRVYPRGSCVPHYDVCERIVSDYPSGRSLSDGPSDADAALIAAAPDLLAALRGIARLIGADASWAEWQAAEAVAIAALNRATGGTHG